MKSSNREEIVDHDAKDLFDIVLDIESYPYFVPWCSAMKVHSKSEKEIYADMVVWYKYFMPQTFGSHVTFDKKKLSIIFENIDIVFHFAGEADIEKANKKPIEAINKNILSTTYLLDLSVKNKVKRFI